MRKKMKKQGGFTLVEMLIVVAIIAILIAVSIPLVTTSLERAREATDAANERSFKAALTVGYLVGDAGVGKATLKIEAGTYAYDAAKGKVVKLDDAGDIKAYGQGESGSSGKDTDPKKGEILFGTITAEGDIYMKWDAPGATVASVASTDENLTSKLLGETTA